MKKFIFSTLITSVLLFCACSKEEDKSSGGTGSLGVTGSTLYFAFGGEYNAYNLQQSRYIERFGTTDALGKIDISWDNKHILAGYERLSFSDYGGHWLTFSYRPLPSLSKEVLATREEVTQQNISTCHYNYTEIAQGRRAGCFLSPNEKYIAIDSKSVTGATDHPVTIINRKTGAEVDSFALENYRPSEVFIIGWTADNSLVMGVENIIFKVSEAKNWAIEELTRLPFNFFHITINPQGTQLAFRREDKHIWVYDLLQKKVSQVTTSDVEMTTAPSALYSGGESNPTFSPDGKYIALLGQARASFTPNWMRLGGTLSLSDILILVSNDGTLHNLDKENDGKTFYPKDGDTPIFSSGSVIWR